MKSRILVYIAIAFPLVSCKTVKKEPRSAADNYPEKFEHLEGMKIPESQIGANLALAAGVTTDSLKLGEVLLLGQSLKSNDGRSSLVFQMDANLVLYFMGRVSWASNTPNSGANRVVFQNDGNFVMVNGQNVPVWNSGTGGAGGVKVSLGNNGNVTIANARGGILWTIGAGGNPAVPVPANQLSTLGRFGETIQWPIIPVHSVLLGNGKVFTFGTNGEGQQGAHFNYDVWNPALGTGANSHQTLPNTLKTDIFCAAAAVMADTGNLLIPGGDGREGALFNKGIKDTLIFGKDSSKLTRAPFMNYARWYATTTGLANGEILVHGGIDAAGNISQVPEVYSPKTNKWRTLLNAADNNLLQNEAGWFYPRNWVASDGRIFGLAQSSMYWMDTNGTGKVTVVGALPPSSRNYTSSAVMYAPGKILQLGGRNTTFAQPKTRSSNQAILVDISNPKVEPKVEAIGAMNFAREWPSTTVLPNGEVLITNGSAIENEMNDVAYKAEMWNPITKKFRVLDTAKYARLYHSTSLLLPDGTVLVGGGGAPGPQVNLNAEIYSPPYLFTAQGAASPRIVAGAVPLTIGYGAKINVPFAGAGPVARVTLIHTGSVTHSDDMSQRFIELAFDKPNATSVGITLPANANLAPPGTYMLFLLNAAGVPSIGKILTLNGAAPVVQPPVVQPPVTQPVPAKVDSLGSGEFLAIDGKRYSADKRFMLVLQGDGKVVLYKGNTALWASGTGGKAVVRLAMQADGKLVALNAANGVVWQAPGTPIKGGHLDLQNDGNMVLRSGDTAYWASNTCCQ